MGRRRDRGSHRLFCAATRDCPQCRGITCESDSALWRRRSPRNSRPLDFDLALAEASKRRGGDFDAMIVGNERDDNTGKIDLLMREIDRSLLRENLKLTFEQRAQKHLRALQMVEEPRRAHRNQSGDGR
jgi:hypothetical protein